MKRVFSNILICSILICICSEVYGQSQEDIRRAKFIMALRDISIGDTTRAELAFNEIIDKNKSDDASYYYLSKIATARKDLLSAKDFMILACNIDTTNYWYKTDLASILVSLGEYDRACTIYESVLDKYPDRSDLYDAIISLYMRQEEYDKALVTMNKIESVIGRGEITGLIRYNIITVQSGRDSAISYLLDFEKEISTARIANVIGDYYASKGESSSSRAYYEKALALDIHFIPAKFGLSESYRMMGDFKNYFFYIIPFMANPIVEPTLKVEYLKQLLSNTSFVRAFYPQVDTMFQNMYYASPQDTSAAYNYAIFLLQTERQEKALDVMRINVENNVEYKEVHEQYLSLLYYLKDWNQLLLWAESAAKLYPDEQSFRQYCAAAFSELKEYEKAIAIFLDMVDKTDRSDLLKISDLYAAIGDTYHRSGDSDKAFKYYDKSLDKNPDNIVTLNNYSYFLSEQNRKIKRAYKMSKRVVEIEPNNHTYLDTYGWILYKMGNLSEAKSIFQKALAMGGDSSAVILDHYATLLYDMNEKDLAFVYWMKADKIDPGLGIAEKMSKIKQNR